MSIALTVLGYTTVESKMSEYQFLEIACELEGAGLVWQPEIGDEISDRENVQKVSILVDPQGMTPLQLRKSYLWLPTVEQLVTQLEIRQALLFHAGMELSTSHLCYKTVVRSSGRSIEVTGESLRQSLGLALKDLLLENYTGEVH